MKQPYSLLKKFGYQEWIRWGVRHKLLLLMVNFLNRKNKKESNYEFVTDYFDIKYKGNLHSFIDWNVFFYGAYEKRDLLLMRDLIKDRINPIFIDIGANTGTHSLFMANYCVQVHSFEPFEPVRKQFEENIRINKIENIFIHPVGLGYQDEVLNFFAPTGFNKGTGSFIINHDRNNKFIDKLHITKADVYISTLKLKNIDIIKIDVEGFEKSVLIGLKNVLYNYRPLVVMEFSETTRESFSDFKELMAMFPQGYSVKKIQTNNPIFFIFNYPRYILKKFDFNKNRGNLLFSPND